MKTTKQQQQQSTDNISHCDHQLESLQPIQPSRWCSQVYQPYRQKDCAMMTTTTNNKKNHNDKSHLDASTLPCFTPALPKQPVANSTGLTAKQTCNDHHPQQQATSSTTHNFTPALLEQPVVRSTGPTGRTTSQSPLTANPAGKRYSLFISLHFTINRRCFQAPMLGGNLER